MTSAKFPEGAIRCLDKGFVRLVDSMGGDDSIVQAARVSYGKGTRKVSQDRGLIRYLMRHRHTTPFEMVEFKFHALPISTNILCDTQKQETSSTFLIRSMFSFRAP